MNHNLHSLAILLLGFALGGGSFIQPGQCRTAPPLGIVEVKGRISYIEERNNLYLEIKEGSRVVGVDIPSRLKANLWKFVEMGTPITVSGRAKKGDSSVAFVIPIQKESQISFGNTRRRARTLVAMPLPAATQKRSSVQMLSAVGLWPPQSAKSITRTIRKHRYGAHRLIIDTGLTELWRAYRKKKPFIQVISRAVAAAKREKIETAFYFPTFEIRNRGKEKSQKGFTRTVRPWAQRTLKGKPWIKSKFLPSEFWNRSGDQVVWTCPNSPWRQTFLSKITDAVGAGVEMVFLDVSYFRWQDKHITCRCQHCQKKFHQETGMQIPRRLKNSEKATPRWLRWRSEKLVEFLRQIRLSMRKINSRSRLIVEEYPGIEEDGPRQTGFEFSLLKDAVDVVAHENSAKQFDKKPYSYADQLRLAAALALYRGLDQERATWVLSYAHDTSQSQRAAAMHLAFDASFWETKAPEMNDTSVSLSWRRKLFSWFAKFQHRFGRSRQLSRLVLLYSATSRRYSTTHFKALMETQRDLLEAGIPYRVVAEGRVDEIPRGDLLVLPGVSRLSGVAKQGVMKRQGKTVGWGMSFKGLEPIKASKLLDHVGESPLAIEGRGVIANLVRRGEEVQVRLVNLRPDSNTVTLKLMAPLTVKRAFALPFLGEEKALKFRRQGRIISVKVEVDSMMLIGFSK